MSEKKLRYDLYCKYNSIGGKTLVHAYDSFYLPVTVNLNCLVSPPGHFSKHKSFSLYDSRKSLSNEHNFKIHDN